MRLDPTPPNRLSPAQKRLYERMRADISAHLQGFVSERADGALLGPFNPFLQFPDFGQAAWGYVEALIKHSSLPKPVHEVAILVTGARFHARYELYAHELVAQRCGLSLTKIATIAAGEKPCDLTEAEAIAYDVAATLSSGGQLAESTYQVAVAIFGPQGVAELIYLVAGYCMVSVVLNGYDVPVPGRDESK